MMRFETGYETENYKTFTFGDWQVPVYRITGTVALDADKLPVIVLPEQGVSPKKMLAGANKWILRLID